jgi:polyphosphate kinase 2 (PPK2 family)
MAMGQKDISTELDTVHNFEQTLADNGTHIVKIFLHLDKKTQKNRLEAKKNLFSTDSNILKMKVGRSKSYKKTTNLHNEIISATHMPHAPWHVIDATNPEWLLARAAQIILDSDTEHKVPLVHLDLPSVSGGSLAAVDLFSTLDRDNYKLRKQQLQDQLYTASWMAWQQKKSPILVFEGWDAAGKGGSIRRITEAIDPRLWTVYGSSAPNEVERQYHHLWRYWKTLPSAGKTSIYDRSWYGRVDRKSVV